MSSLSPIGCADDELWECGSKVFFRFYFFLFDFWRGVLGAMMLAQVCYQWQSQKIRRRVSEIIARNIKFNNSYKLKLNNDYIKSNLIVLDATSYFKSGVKYYQ